MLALAVTPAMALAGNVWYVGASGSGPAELVTGGAMNWDDGLSQNNQNTMISFTTASKAARCSGCDVYVRLTDSSLAIWGERRAF